MVTEHEEVAAPATVFILGEGGGVFELSLPLHETIADKLAAGHLRRVADKDGTPYVEGDRPDGVPSLPESRPALNALKGEWVGWAVVQGLTPDEAEALTKTDLIERFGAGTVPESTPDGQEPPAGPPADPATGTEGEQPPAE